MTPDFRIDAHHHLWDLAKREQTWTEGLPELHRTFTMDDLIPHLIDNDIAGTVLVQTINDPEETPELLLQAHESPYVLGVVGWIDLTNDVADQIAFLQSQPGGDALKGVRHLVQGEPDVNWLARPDVRDGLREVGDANLVYDILVYPHQIDVAISTVRALPEVTFVLDHCGKPRINDGVIDEWRRQMVELSASENVAVKLSGLVTEADRAHWSERDLQPYVDVVLDSFSPRRVMFGSDWPVCQLAATYDEVVSTAESLTASLGSDEKNALFGATASQWYGLEAE
jgi:L-fuconolactonase